MWLQAIDEPERDDDDPEDDPEDDPDDDRPGLFEDEELDADRQSDR